MNVSRKRLNYLAQKNKNAADSWQNHFAFVNRFYDAPVSKMLQCAKPLQKVKSFRLKRDVALPPLIASIRERLFPRVRQKPSDPLGNFDPSAPRSWRLRELNRHERDHRLAEEKLENISGI